MERCRAEKAEAEKELTQFKASTELDTQRSDLSGHPQFQRVSEPNLKNLHVTNVKNVLGFVFFVVSCDTISCIQWYVSRCATTHVLHRTADPAC